MGKGERRRRLRLLVCKEVATTIREKERWLQEGAGNERTAGKKGEEKEQRGREGRQGGEGKRQPIGEVREKGEGETRVRFCFC